MKYNKISNTSCTDQSCKDKFMKGEEYINITKQFGTSVVYNCYSSVVDDMYVNQNLLYTIKFNYLHTAHVYDKCGNVMGMIEGRGTDWNYSSYLPDSANINISIYDFPSTDGSQMDIRVKVDNWNGETESYRTEKPKQKGWYKHSLDFKYMNKHLRPSQSNFKLIKSNKDIVSGVTSDSYVMISGKLKKHQLNNKKYHCITNLNILDAFIIFCVKNWCKKLV